MTLPVEPGRSARARDDRTASTVADQVLAAQTWLFAGRGPELAAVSAALAEARSRPVLLMVYGPAGIGKSALLHAACREAAASGLRAVQLDGAVVERTPEEIVRALAAALPRQAQGRTASFPSTEQVVERINRIGASSGLLLAIDAYEKWQACDRWLRAEILSHLGPGILVMLTSRRSPVELYSGEPAWQAVFSPLPLADLPLPDARELLRRRGIGTESAQTGILSVTGGHPLLLHLAADLHLQGRADESGERAVASGLVSRWVAEWGQPELKDLLAAASLLRSFEPGLLAAMVGAGTVAQAWPQLIQLPAVATAAKGRYTLHDAVRQSLRAALSRDRPWAERRWRQRAIAHTLDEAADGLAADDVGAWGVIADLATHTVWHGWLHPEVEHKEQWHFERGVSPADLGGLTECLDATMAAVFYGGDPKKVVPGLEGHLQALLTVYPEGFTLARGPSGQILGYYINVPLRPSTRQALLAHPLAGDYLRTLSVEAVDALEGRLLVAAQLVLRHPRSELAAAMMREICGEFGRYEQVLLVAPASELGTTCDLLGFERQAGFEASLPGSEAEPATAFILRLGPSRFAAWLRQMAGPELAGTIGVGQRVQAARGVLEAFHSDGGLTGSVAGRYFEAAFPPLSAGRMRGWILDALAEAGEGGVILRRYYVSREGPHEAAADELHLGRRTYFRKLKDGLAEVSELLFT